MMMMLREGEVRRGVVWRPALLPVAKVVEV